MLTPDQAGYASVAVTAISQCAVDYRQLLELIYEPVPCAPDATTQLRPLRRPPGAMMRSDELRLYAAVQSDAGNGVYKLQLAIESGELDREMVMWAQVLQEAMADLNDAGSYSELQRVSLLTSYTLGKLYGALNARI